MEKVDGIGGFFFKAQDPKALAEWYNKNLGIDLTPSTYSQQPWQQTAGPTAFEPFDWNTADFGEASRMWKINFRVKDLAAMVKQLQDAGIAVNLDPKQYPNGTFAQLNDPEGNPIELWQPA